MKPATCFVLAVLAAAAIADVASKTVHEAATAKVRDGIDGPLAQGRKELARHEGLGGLAGRAHAREHAEDSGGRCVTRDMCKKKKLICNKQCIDSFGNGVDADHAPGSKCIVKCKKCVPNC